MIRRPRKGADSGAAALELALVLPLFVALVFGIFNFGWALYVGGEVRNAIERGSRLLIANPDATQDQLRAAVSGRLRVVKIDQINLTLTKAKVAGHTDIAKITWTYSHTVSTPFLPAAVFNFDNDLVVPLRD